MSSVETADVRDVVVVIVEVTSAETLFLGDEGALLVSSTTTSFSESVRGTSSENLSSGFTACIEAFSADTVTFFLLGFGKRLETNCVIEDIAEGGLPLRSMFTRVDVVVVVVFVAVVSVTVVIAVIGNNEDLLILFFLCENSVDVECNDKEILFTLGGADLDLGLISRNLAELVWYPLETLE